MRTKSAIGLCVVVCLGQANGIAAPPSDATDRGTAAHERTQAAAVSHTAFSCDPQGYVRHWAIIGLDRKPYQGGPASDNTMRQQAIDLTIVTPPTDTALGESGPFGQSWRFYHPGENVFVEQSDFYYKLETLDLYAVTLLHVPDDRTVPVRFWALGTADLWLNGRHVERNNVPRYMYPDSMKVDLPLSAGVNRVCVRLQGVGIRDTRLLFGLQVLEHAEDIAVTVPCSDGTIQKLLAADAWLRSVSAPDPRTLVSAVSAPPLAGVNLDETLTPWAESETSFAVPTAAGAMIGVEVTVDGQRLSRQLEIPARQSEQRVSANKGDHQLACIARVTSKPHANERLRDRAGAAQLLALRLANRPGTESDKAAFDGVLRFVDERNDCADFAMAGLLRVYALKVLSPSQAKRVRDVVLNFRYWSDETGTDAMYMFSENHSLLFHGSQLVAGRLFPDDHFVASNRSGAQQARIGADRCREWFEKLEAQHGFREFLSSTYLPITMAALMNVVDFSGDSELSDRAAGVVDKIFRSLAMHSFDGVNVAPQGRVYRNILSPQRSSTQAMLYYANPDAEPAYSDWNVFLASSPSYRVPDNVRQLMQKPVENRYREHMVEICLKKTPGYMLSSLQIPASFGGSLKPGRRGYQQHLWHATLGKDCHVFVNHPGATFDLTKSRPGFWYGNGVIPRLTQEGNRLGEVFDVPEDHSVAFTHAHWPSDVFNRQEVREHWAFGTTDKGHVALWCSNRMQPHNDVLTKRELRAWGRHAGWLCLCEEASVMSFEQFITDSENLSPKLQDNQIHLADGSNF